MQMRSLETPARIRPRAWSPKNPIIWRMIGASSGKVKRRCELSVRVSAPVAAARAAALPVGREGRMSSSCTCLRSTRAPRPSLFQCITMQPQSDPAATATISGSVKPETSLMIDAPRRTHIFATSAWRVSMETIAPAATNARTTGTTRSASSVGRTGV